MTWLDGLGQRARISQARGYIPHGARVLDVGCGEGTLFDTLAPLIGEGVGIDPTADESASSSRFAFVRGRYPESLPETGQFDVIVGLAVFEHLSHEQQAAMAAACFRDCRSGGRVILTVPSALVDPILHVLHATGLAEAPALHEHHGFRAVETSSIFELAGFALGVHRHFEFGLNNLFVFAKETDRSATGRE